MDQQFDIFDNENEDFRDFLLGQEYDSDQLSDSDSPHLLVRAGPPPPPFQPPTRPRDPIQIQRTNLLRGVLNGPLVDKVRRTLQFMDTQGINLPIFLDALSWGDQACIQDSKIMYERSGLMHSEELPGIIRRWYKPPRAPGSHGARANAAAIPMQTFAVECVHELLDAELSRSQDLMRPPADGLSDKSLTGFSIDEKISDLRKPGGVPLLWSLVRRLLVRRNAAEPSRKDPNKVAFTIISQIAFTRNHHLSYWPKLMTIYLKGVGLAAKGIDLLHAVGLSMSHKWSVRAFQVISKEAMKEAEKIVRTIPFVFSHDNINIAFTAYSQREDNKTHFDSGTAGTLFSQPSAPLPSTPLSNPGLQASREAGSKTPITAEEILDLQDKAGLAIHKQLVYHALRFLLDTPSFDLASYAGRKSPALAPPPPVEQLPYGPRWITQENVMSTVHIEEASYEGNERLIMEWLRQLMLISPEEIKRTGLERIFVWIGDQLTVERLRTLIRYRSHDVNAFDRLDWIVPIFGWFHLEMAFANSMHKQHLGTNAGKGLLHAITNLERKGLASVQTKGPFYHHLDEVLMHKAEAHFRACWKVVGGVDDLRRLRTRSPEELVALAEKLVREHASVDALDAMKEKPEKEQDEVFRNTILWNRDMLRYIELHTAIKTGDVGRMENMLPYLLSRFAGGGNHKYAVEVLELLQGLHYEWPEDLRNYIRTRGWLVNMKGQSDSFLPIDMAQEHNVKDIKVTYRSQGPNAGWDLLYKRGPAIPKVRMVRAHFERLFPSLKRGESHTSPQKETDVDKLEQIYTEAKVHIFKKGRKAAVERDVVKDTVTDGWKYATTKLMPKWASRRVYPRAKGNLWSIEEAVQQDAERERARKRRRESDDDGSRASSSMRQHGGSESEGDGELSAARGSDIDGFMDE
ncbi:hypothetical protein BV25DRAFT_1922704 [Artomyces pyxidatus]|uniref:Uncharacterized protein n=1 Tax=Artomyces pyxidatus TaxID=48021 RepID=A0ACB8SEU5_9AGAM|nr:hypothetical protein BV25DRAFT_1922704 [Artomyces pyxidatus]